MILEKERLLYFHVGLSSFVVKDIEIFREDYKVLDFFFDTHDKRKYPFRFLQQIGFLLRHIISAKLIVCQFAGHYAFFPILFSRLFFKRSVVIAGGTDCVSFPSIRYGNFYTRLLRATTTFCFRRCDLIIPVHQTLVEYDYTYQDKDYPKQGFRFFIPGIKTRCEVVYNGYDSDKWFCDTGKQAASFVTVGAGLGSRFGFELKGIDLIFEVASRFPEATFYIVGGGAIQKQPPPNVKLLDKIPNEELQRFLSRMRFYMQLSVSEGFPNALSEAMLCECVPIVSNVGGMPDIVSDTGFILKHKNADELSAIIDSALKSDALDSLGKHARERIKHNFTFENRKQKLLSLINKLG